MAYPSSSGGDVQRLVKEVAHREQHHRVREEQGDAQAHLHEGGEVHRAATVGEVQGDDVLRVCSCTQHRLWSCSLMYIASPIKLFMYM